VRKMRSIALTPAGEALYPGLPLGFAQIRQSVELLDTKPNDGILVVSASPGFPSKWLAPRLYRFMQVRPDFETRVSANVGFANFLSDGVDVAIRFGRRPTTGLWARPLLPISVLPVARPEQGLREPADLAKVALIHDEMLGAVTGTPRWSDWFAAAGLPDLHAGGGLRFTSPDHAQDAAVEGAGALLAHYAMAYDDLRTGRLVCPFGPRLHTQYHYQLVTLDTLAVRPKVKAFVDWILAEAEAMAPLDLPE